MQADLEFLLKAANYEGPAGSSHSAAARLAVDAVAERLRVVAELQLGVAKRRAESKDPAAIAAQQEAAGLDLE